MISIPLCTYCQIATLYGNIRDEVNMPLKSVSIKLSSTGNIFLSNETGDYEIEIPSDKNVTVTFSFVGFENYEKLVHLNPGQRYPLYVIMVSKPIIINDVTVQNQEIRDQAGMVKIDPKNFAALPSASGGVEAILKVLGAQSNNELSSQYSVRGGNFDENLVYVNDFEIYRPYLTRSGQQEGLSFINPDLVSSLQFSAGGFQSKYGDKMSSVLDVDYKKPVRFGGSASISLLGGSLTLEEASKDQRFTLLIGARYKSNQYLLNSLPTKGDYHPSFSDFQTYLTYDISDKISLEGIANYSGNTYQFVPDSQVTTFGTIKTTLRLRVFFDGQEIDRYTNAMGGIALNYKPVKNLHLKFLASAYKDREDETYDILGEYFLGLVNNSFGSSGFGNVLFSLGVGGDQEWGRDFLDASVVKLEHKGFYTSANHYVQWGLGINREENSYNLSEWSHIDSAGYSLPYSTSSVFLQNVIRNTFNITSFRYSGYLQDAWTLNAEKDFILNAGARFTYWDFNRQFLISPRAQVSYQPRWKHDLVFRASVGVYDQPPFLRELVDLYGNIHPGVLAQRSVQFVVGTDYNFKIWDRPFKFVSEIYFKKLTDLNPYELDNVRIRYYGLNDATGFAEGIDLRLNGDFVKDAESWISISWLKTKENLIDDFDYSFTFDTTFNENNSVHDITTDTTIVHPGYIPRPSDQRINFGMFFQDYIPGNENFKVHLSVLFGTGLPTGPPDHFRDRDTLRLSPYRRVDIGFSYLLLDGKKEKNLQSKLWHNFKSSWIDLEVFNLFGVSNEISYSWVKTTDNAVFAVPNYLTSRRINLRLVVNF
ncbi:MAG: TonB-dependent receptor [Chitinophagales bacterium]|nr:TonB-dependent receptor [Chitinophagales bacterium]